MADKLIDPGTKFTGGLKIVFQNPAKGYQYGPSHIALENQPLSSFIEAALCQKERLGRKYRILHFDPAIGEILVEADLTSHHMH